MRLSAVQRCSLHTDKAGIADIWISVNLKTARQQGLAERDLLLLLLLFN
jgi:hypothetical protein